MVMAPANTGRDRSNKTAVISTDHANRGTRSSSIPNTRKLPKVLIKFTAPKWTLHRLNEEKKWQSQQTPLHGQYFLITEEKEDKKGEKMEVDEKKEDEKDKEKKEPEATFEMLANPARVMKAQLKVINLEDERYAPVKDLSIGE